MITKNVTILLPYPLVLSILFEPKLNDVVAMHSNGAKIPLSNFNDPDNKFWGEHPHFDNFGVSFMSSALRDADCGDVFCEYNLYTLPEYYIAYRQNNEIISQMVVVLGFALAPTLSPTRGSQIPSPSPTILQNVSAVPTSLRFISSQAATKNLIPLDAAIVGMCVMGVSIVTICLGFCLFCWRNYKRREWVLEERPFNLNAAFDLSAAFDLN